jgi:hypothetical protein
MSRIFGMAGLLLVPVGGMWVATGYWSRLARKQYGIAIAATRGHYAVHDAPHPHWKYFWFD